MNTNTNTNTNTNSNNFILDKSIQTYSRIKCQIYTHSKKNLRNDFILLVGCYLPSTILIEVCTLQIKSLSSNF